MKGEYVSLLWNPAGREAVERKIGEKPPLGVIKILRQYKTKTVYLVPKKATWIITVRGENGALYKEDIYGIVKYYKPEIKVTASFRKKLEDYMREYPFEVDENYFHNLYKGVEEFLKI